MFFWVGFYLVPQYSFYISNLLVQFVCLECAGKVIIGGVRYIIFKYVWQVELFQHSFSPINLLAATKLWNKNNIIYGICLESYYLHLAALI